MNNQIFSRRSFFAKSTAAIGFTGLMTTPIHAIDRLAMQEKLEQVIFQNIKGSEENPSLVKTFVKDLLSNKIDALESETFINKESRKFDQGKLERFVVVQFMLSEAQVIK